MISTLRIYRRDAILQLKWRISFGYSPQTYRARARKIIDKDSGKKSLRNRNFGIMHRESNAHAHPHSYQYKIPVRLALVTAHGNLCRHKSHILSSVRCVSFWLNKPPILLYSTLFVFVYPVKCIANTALRTRAVSLFKWFECIRQA